MLSEGYEEKTADAYRRFPELCPYGLRHYRGNHPVEPRSIRDDEVATAMAFLRRFHPTKKGTASSYWLKHEAENWGRKNGMSGYVSNGAMLIAALLLGFTVLPHRSPSPNAQIGLSKRDIHKFTSRRYG
ncbi:hypothetical protein [Bradyrhizobium sp. DOA9]|uniref:hypothetical protein n=1 Tax=Bradyrhizobium sp. DOA9 TaxID=1126627 RepID=UPI0007234792|nr:hypothetical protein [Bradyrhizobium sp. DOA9]GAJ35244.1 hypothetical protein BDOA9_0144450 [Bradyrhizobium sp. DOA9]